MIRRGNHDAYVMVIYRSCMNAERERAELSTFHHLLPATVREHGVGKNNTNQQATQDVGIQNKDIPW